MYFIGVNFGSFCSYFRFQWLARCSQITQQKTRRDVCANSPQILCTLSVCPRCRGPKTECGTKKWEISQVTWLTRSGVTAQVGKKKSQKAVKDPHPYPPNLLKHISSYLGRSSDSSQQHLRGPQQHPGGWMRGHQDGGVRQEQALPKYITGKNLNIKPTFKLDASVFSLPISSFFIFLPVSVCQPCLYFFFSSITLCKSTSCRSQCHVESCHKNDRQFPCIWSSAKAYAPKSHEPQYQKVALPTERDSTENGNNFLHRFSK